MGTGANELGNILELVESHRMGLCRNTYLLNHAEAQKQVHQSVRVFKHASGPVKDSMPINEFSDRIPF